MPAPYHGAAGGITWCSSLANVDIMSKVAGGYGTDETAARVYNSFRGKPKAASVQILWYCALPDVTGMPLCPTPLVSALCARTDGRAGGAIHILLCRSGGTERTAAWSLALGTAYQYLHKRTNDYLGSKE